MDVNWTYRGDHFAINPYSKSFCCTPETNIILYINYISTLTKFMNLLLILSFKNHQHKCDVELSRESPLGVQDLSSLPGSTSQEQT